MTIPPHDITNYRNRDWVQANADDLFDIIDNEMRDPDTVSLAAYRITLIFPHLIALVGSLFQSRHDIKAWARLIDNVLCKLDITPNNRDPLRPEYVFHPLCVIQRVDHTTKVRQKTRRRRFRLNPRQMFESYLIIVMYLLFYDEMDVPPEIIADLLALARMVNSQHHYHKLYQILAVVYTMDKNTDRAVSLGNLAFEYFNQTGNAIEAGLTALILAQVYTTMNVDDKVSHWLNIAVGQIPEAHYPLQHEEIARLGNSIMGEVVRDGV